VLAARLRQRRERQLAQVRRVAEVTQRALLRPLPPFLGPVSISSMYLAADEEAAIGGDLYAAARMPQGSRVMVGDVQGKGLSAVEVTALLLGAFRRAVRDCTPLAALPGYLDSDLRDDLSDLARDAPDPPGQDPRPAAGARSATAVPAAGSRTGNGNGAGAAVAAGRSDAGSEFGELFVTAVAVDVADDGCSVRVANCGHPPPLLIHEGTVSSLFPGVPELPLGLGDLSGGQHHIDVHPFAVGDILLLYTDGVIEARDREGTFYPLAERLPRWTAETPEALLEDIRADLLRHADARLSDDIAMVAVQRVV
jgi:serine phosphatase RsbU (regulator of sigma subunit)